MFKPALIALTAATLLSPLTQARTYPTKFEEVTITLDHQGNIHELYNNTQYPIDSSEVPSFRKDVGFYDIYLNNFMSIDQDYRKTAVTCSISTSNYVSGPNQNVACYQVNGNTIIRVRTNTLDGHPIDASTTVNVKWESVE